MQDASCQSQPDLRVQEGVREGGAEGEEWQRSERAREREKGRGVGTPVKGSRSERVVGSDNADARQSSGAADATFSIGAMKQGLSKGRGSGGLEQMKKMEMEMEMQRHKQKTNTGARCKLGIRQRAAEKIDGSRTAAAAAASSPGTCRP